MSKQKNEVINDDQKKLENTYESSQLSEPNKKNYTKEEIKERKKFIIKGIMFIFAMGWIVLFVSALAQIIS